MARAAAVKILFRLLLFGQDGWGRECSPQHVMDFPQDAQTLQESHMNISSDSNVDLFVIMKLQISDRRP